METAPRLDTGADTAAVDFDTGLEIAASAYAPDARAMAILRGIEIARNDLVQAGGAYDLAQVQKLLGDVSRQAVAKRVQEGSLLAVPGPQNRRCYPTFQFGSDGTLVEGLSDVIAALPTANPWAVMNFLVHPDARLDGNAPIALLRRGMVTQVAQAAAQMGEQGG